MARMRWRWNRTIPSSFVLTTVLLGVVAAVLRAELRARVDWPAVGLAIVVAAAVIAVGLGFVLPVGAAVDDDGVHLAYLHRRELLVWPQILELFVGPDGSATLGTSHRSIDLGIPGRALVAELAGEMRRRKRRVRTLMPEEYPPPDTFVPPVV